MFPAVQAKLFLGRAKDIARGCQVGESALTAAFIECIVDLSGKTVVLPSDAPLCEFAAEAIRLARDANLDGGDVLRLLRAALPVRTARDSRSGDHSPAPVRQDDHVFRMLESIERFGSRTDSVQVEGLSELVASLAQDQQKVVDTHATHCAQLPDLDLETRRKFPRYVWSRDEGGSKVSPSLMAKAVNKVLAAAGGLSTAVTSAADPKAAVGKAIAAWRKPNTPLTVAERLEFGSWAAALARSEDPTLAATMLAEVSLLFFDVDATVGGRDLRLRVALARFAQPAQMAAGDEAAWVRGQGQPEHPFLPE